MKENEANTELMRLRVDVLNNKCPLNHFKNCDLTCQSFFEGNVIMRGKDNYGIQNPACVNALVTGIVTHEE